MIEADVVIVVAEKICKKCFIIKPLPDFSLAKQCADGYRNECKACRSLIEKARPKSHRISESYGYKKNQRLKTLYGITFEDYEAMYAAQDGKCAICGTDGTTWYRPNDRTQLVVDHNHRTGQVRELLCHHCNTTLGNFKEDPAILLKAIEYLQRHQLP